MPIRAFTKISGPAITPISNMSSSSSSTKNIYDEMLTTAKKIGLIIRNYFYLFTAFSKGAFSNIILPFYPKFFLFIFKSSSRVINDENLKKFDKVIIKRNILFKKLSSGYCERFLEIFNKLFRNDIYKKKFLEKSKRVEKLRKEYKTLFYTFPWPSTKTFKKMYSDFKNLSEKFNLNPKDIVLVMNPHFRNMTAATISGIPKITNSILIIANCDSSDQGIGIRAHELAHISKHHSIKNNLLFLAITITTIFIASLFSVQYALLFLPFAIISQYKFSRFTEKEADLLAAKKVGPKGLISFFEDCTKKHFEFRKQILKDKNSSFFQKTLTRIKISDEGNNRFDFSHPSFTDRIKYLKAFDSQSVLA